MSFRVVPVVTAVVPRHAWGGMSPLARRPPRRRPLGTHSDAWQRQCRTTGVRHGRPSDARALRTVTWLWQLCILVVDQSGALSLPRWVAQSPTILVRAALSGKLNPRWCRRIEVSIMNVCSYSQACRSALQTMPIGMGVPHDPALLNPAPSATEAEYPLRMNRFNLWNGSPERPYPIGTVSSHPPCILASVTRGRAP